MAEGKEERVRYPQPQSIELLEIFYSNPLLTDKEVERAHGRMKHEAKYGCREPEPEEDLHIS